MGFNSGFKGLSEKGKGRPYFSYGDNLDYIYMLTVKVYDILCVKKALVVSCVVLKEHHCNFLLPLPPSDNSNAVRNNNNNNNNNNKLKLRSASQKTYRFKIIKTCPLNLLRRNTSLLSGKRRKDAARFKERCWVFEQRNVGAVCQSSTVLHRCPLAAHLNLILRLEAVM